MQENINNFFILDEPDRKRVGKRTYWVNLANKIFEKLKLSHRLKRLPDPNTDMNSIEMRINLFHLISMIINEKTEGEVVEFGTYLGETAILIQKTLNYLGSDKELHVYDTFDVKFSEFSSSVEEEMKKSFLSYNLQLPIIHKGFFEDTFPTGLPEKIAFAHIDCGILDDAEKHKEVMLYCLESLYPKLSKGGICVFMDYVDERNHKYARSTNPGVKMACDIFFKDKPEKIISLCANEGSHAYFKKI
ncbi:MAG: TylF/MycF/NovP-related O-methyltransferase [Niabella sp.]